MKIDSLKILVVDDVPEILIDFESVLQELGIEKVSTAKSGTEAKNIAKDYGPYDIVFCDWHLPDTNGPELSKQFKKDSPDTHFVIFTSETNKALITKAFKSGIDGLFFKPIKKENITRQILNFLKGKTDNGQLEDEIKQAVDEIYERELVFLQEILKSTNDFIIVLDYNYRISKVNCAFTNAIGLTEGEVIGKSIENYLKDSQILLNSLRSGAFKKENRIEFKAVDGTIYQTLLTITPIESESLGLNGLLLMAKSIKHELELQNELAIALKDECMAGLASGMSHEINNSLMILMGKLLKLERRFHNKQQIEKEDQDLIDSIRENSHKIHHITKSLKDYTQENNTKDKRVEKVTVGEIINHMISLIDMRLKNSNIFLQLNNYDPNFLLETNVILFNKVIMQIMENSIKAVSTLKHKTIELDFDYKDEFSITFIDSGDGIPNEVRDKIFDPFFTTGIFGRDKGLGMSVSKGMMQKIGGDLTLEEISSSARVKITIPLK